MFLIPINHRCQNLDLELHFSEFRKNVVGLDQTFMSPYGEKNHLC